MKKFILLSAIILSCAGLANAQSYSYGNDMKQVYSINYQMNVPMGSSKDFVSNASFEGVNINWAYFVTENIAVGLDLSYNNYHKLIFVLLRSLLLFCLHLLNSLYHVVVLHVFSLLEFEYGVNRVCVLDE